MDNPIYLLGFLSIFHAAGGFAIGYSVRGLLHGRIACQSLFMLIWGGLFGGVPLLVGADQLRQGNPLFLPIQLAVFAGTILLISLTPDTLMETLNAPAVRDILTAGLVLLVGVFAVGMGIRESKDVLQVVLAGGIFAAVGTSMFVNALRSLLKS